MSDLLPVGLSRDERMWGMLCHLSSLSGLFTGIGFILGPLIVWLIKKDEYPFVDSQGKESINFQITSLIVSAVITVIGFVTCGFGFLLFAPMGIAYIVLIIMASVAANDGKHYRYPFNIRLVS